jgi:phage terminase small subunit
LPKGRPKITIPEGVQALAKIPPGLTERDVHFIEVYLRTSSATEAYKAIGGTRNSDGHRFLKTPRIAAEIDKRRRKLLDKMEVTPEMVLNELAHVAFARMSDVIKVGPTGEAHIDLTDLTPSSKVALKSITMETQTDPKGRALETRRVKVDFHDKMRALDALARHFDLYNEKERKLTVTGPNGGPVQVETTRAVLENLTPEALAEVERALAVATARETATDVEDFG